jgi:hypothetical protein
VSTGLENLGKSLNWKKIPGLEIPESSGISFLNLQNKLSNLLNKVNQRGKFVPFSNIFQVLGP